MFIDVEITYLEMTSPGDLRPQKVSRSGVNCVRVEPPMPELNRFFYTAVGGDWYWFERLPWTMERWMNYLDRPELETWILTVEGVPAGYFELEAQPDGGMEVAYFGLLPYFIGQGLGAHLLTAAVERAWARGAKRVWLHTCTLDHAAALSNYQARGFRVFKKEARRENLPDETPGPWPGARVRTPSE